MRYLRTDHGDGAGVVDPHQGFKVGDRVRIGRGTTVWTIGAFWGDRDELASLEPVDGYTGTSVLVSRLRAVRS
jgi:hypothetical protein